MTLSDLTRPIIGIENRTPQEAFDIMCDRIRSAPPQREGLEEAGPTHRHKKRGTEYVLIGYGKMQSERWLDGTTVQFSESGPSGFYDDKLTQITLNRIDMREVAIYRSVDDGSLWVCPREEFEDGRFDALTGKGGE